jgi:hypothetical protein
MTTSSGTSVLLVTPATEERTSEVNLNALRFRNRVKKSLLEDDDMDSVKLKQIIATASFVCDSLNHTEQSSTNGASLRSQLEELKGDLVDRLKDAESIIHTARPVTDQMKKDPSVVKRRFDIGTSNDTNEASGESIHTLLQQQKVISTRNYEFEYH